MRKVLFLVLLLLLHPGFAQLQSSTLNPVSEPWQQFSVVGIAKLNFLFWSVYTARLLSETPAFEFSAQQPFALELEYQRSFSKEDLVSETRRQWKQTGTSFERGWIEQLSTLLVDVQEKDQITLYVDASYNSHFYFNGSFVGAIKDPEFTRQFAGIWLSERTTRPKIRSDLLGQS
jgi:hypothetical protein